MPERRAERSKGRMKCVHITESQEPFLVQRGAVAAGVEWGQGSLGQAYGVGVRSSVRDLDTRTKDHTQPCRQGNRGFFFQAEE